MRGPLRALRSLVGGAFAVVTVVALTAWFATLLPTRAAESARCAPAIRSDAPHEEAVIRAALDAWHVQAGAWPATLDELRTTGLLTAQWFAEDLDAGRWGYRATENGPVLLPPRHPRRVERIASPFDCIPRQRR